MKIIYISIAVIILSVGGYYAYQWYKGRKATPIVTATTVTTNNPAHIIPPGRPIAVNVGSIH